MFVRKIVNRSGSTSVQIISKKQSQYKVMETVGCSKDELKIEELWEKAQIRLQEIEFKNQPSLFVDKDEVSVKDFLRNLKNSQVRVVGPELILGKLFDRIGFNKIDNQLLRDLVITRLVYPVSKLKTVEYLKKYKDIEVSVSSIYRFLDKLESKYKEDLEEIAFNYSKKILGDKISVVFYDLTTLYFEADDGDDLRKIGFSKDGKFQQPQIMLGFLVGLEGYPIGYDVFEGNTFEGVTLIPILEKFQKKFDLEKPTVIADSGLLSQQNISDLTEKNYEYILGARIKSVKKKIKQQVLDLRLSNGESSEILIVDKNITKRLIVSYSDKRAKKDKGNREKGLKRLEKRVKAGKLTKSNINSRGYNKYLILKNKIDVEIDYKKFKTDICWDGLKGYVTNSSLSKKTVIDNYRQLWQVEKAFRISKTDLRIRPIYHRLKNRIEAHICIAFMAYTIYKELERILKKEKSLLSPQKAIESTQHMYEINYLLPKSLKMGQVILEMDKDQKFLYDLVNST